MIAKTPIDVDAEQPQLPGPNPRVPVKQFPRARAAEAPEHQPEAGTSEATDDSTEDKAGKFKRVAATRVNSVLKAITLLGNCANRSTYEFTEPQVERILEVLRKAVDDLGESFSPVQKDSEEFHFEE